MSKRKRNIGLEIRDGLRELKRGDYGRVINIPDVAKIRESVGLSQSRFATLLGVSVRTLQDWEQGRRALLVPAPKEQHNFGVLMVAEFLRRAGWDVSAQPVISSKQAVEIVSGEWYAILGLSLSCEDGLDDLALEITDARKQSRNEDLAVIVGGRVFVDHPEYAVQVGADAMAVDGRHAVLQADSLHTLLMARC